MKTKLLLTLTLSALTLSACELRIEGEGDFSPNSPASFNGNWRSNCSTVTPDTIVRTQDMLAGVQRSFARTMGNTDGSRHTMNVLDDQITYKIISYDTTDCQIPQFTLRAYLKYSLYSQSAFNNLHDLDLRYDTVTITPENSQVAAIFNDSGSFGFCDSRTWEAGVPKDVSGRECAGQRIDFAGERYYSTIDLAGDTVYFDLANKSLHSSNRPLSAGSRAFYRD